MNEFSVNHSFDDFLTVPTNTLDYLGLDADEFNDYFSELSDADKLLCINILTQLSTSTSDPERDDLKTQLYDLLSLVPDAELSNVLNSWK